MLLKIKIYKIDLEYIKHLYYNYDNRVQYNEKMSMEYNQNRPYIGILLDIKGIQYFAPLEHPRPQHKTLKSNPHIIKIKDGNYGLIGLNNMIPVHKSHLIEFDINKDKNKDILITQFIFCQKKINTIREKALNIYERRTLNPNSFEEKIYCDFKKLEKGLLDYCKDKEISPSSVELEATRPITMIERMEAAKKASKEQVSATLDKQTKKDSKHER